MEIYNEVIFIVHIFCLIGITYISLFLGKNAIMTWVTIQPLIANLFLAKQILLFNHNVTTTDAFIVSSFFGLNIIQNNFGKETAVKVIYATTANLFFLVLLSQIQLLYKPLSMDYANEAYNLILSKFKEFCIVSALVLMFVEFLDVYIFMFLKYIKIRPAWLLFISSLMVSQTVDTIIFTTIFRKYFISPMDVFTMALIIKFIAIFICSLFSSIMLSKKSE